MPQTACVQYTLNQIRIVWSFQEIEQTVMMFRNFKFIQHKNKEKGSKRDTDGRNRVQVLVPFSALAAIAGLLSFDVASVSRYHFQIRRPREVKESEGNPFVWGSY